MECNFNFKILYIFEYYEDVIKMLLAFLQFADRSFSMCIFSYIRLYNFVFTTMLYIPVYIYIFQWLKLRRIFDDNEIR